MNYRYYKIIGLLILHLFLYSSFVFAQEYFQVRAAIHLSSTVSDGRYTPGEIARIARESKVSVVVMTDRDVMYLEYGIWPLRNIIKKRFDNASVFQFGIKNYLQQIKRLNEDFPDMVFLTGVESAPFYYWEGSAFKKNLKMRNWHKHILAIGLNTIDDYRKLPVIGNPRGLRTGFNIFKLWPILLLFAGILCFQKRRYGYKDGQGKSVGPFDKKYRVAGLFLCALGLLFFMNNWPFCGVKYDQYRGELGSMPYQNFIDYVSQRNGLTFWAHPEASNLQNFGSVTTQTEGYSSELLRTGDYTGFAIFHEGCKEIGSPGGLWDEILKQYCQGRRERPVWAIAELNFDYKEGLGEYMKSLTNALLVSEVSETGALQALRDGRMSAARGASAWRFILDKFVIKDIATGIEKTMGEELVSSGDVYLEMSGHFSDKEKLPVQIKIIKNGRVIKTLQRPGYFFVSYKLGSGAKGEKEYYRLEIQSENLHLVTNPIFLLRS